jgi:hypothetical protein
MELAKKTPPKACPERSRTGWGFIVKLAAVLFPDKNELAFTRFCAKVLLSISRESRLSRSNFLGENRKAALIIFPGGLVHPLHHNH